MNRALKKFEFLLDNGEDIFEWVVASIYTWAERQAYETLVAGLKEVLQGGKKWEKAVNRVIALLDQTASNPAIGKIIGNAKIQELLWLDYRKTFKAQKEHVRTFWAPEFLEAHVVEKFASTDSVKDSVAQIVSAK